MVYEDRKFITQTGHRLDRTGVVKMDLVSPDDALLFGLLVQPGRPLVRDQLEVEAVLCCQLRDRLLLGICTEIVSEYAPNFQNMHRNRLDSPVTCHVQVQNKATCT